MQRIHFALFAAAIALCGAGRGQSVLWTPNAPYTATRTRTETQDGKITTRSRTIARTSDGSTYEAVTDPDVVIPYVTIHDVARRQYITLYPTFHTYTIRPEVVLVAHPPPHSLPPEYVQLYKSSVQPTPGEKHENGDCELAALGQRTIEGFETFGWSWSCPSARVTYTETWYSPSLDETIEGKTKQTSPDLTTETKLTGIHPGDPDPALFEVPADYKEVPPGHPNGQ